MVFFVVFFFHYFRRFFVFFFFISVSSFLFFFFRLVPFLLLLLQIFDLFTGEVVSQLVGHNEEILSLKAVEFKGQFYLLSTSQDGYLIKWHLRDDFK